MTETMAVTTIRQLVEHVGFEVLETATLRQLLLRPSSRHLDPRVVATLEGAHPRACTRTRRKRWPQ